MSDPQLLIDRPDDGEPSAWVVLAHGAGAPMTSPFMTRMAVLLTARGLAVVRFEFAYMAARRIDARRRPPPRAERLVSEFEAAVASLITLPDTASKPLLIGGKSMGARVATLTADTLFAAGRIAGAFALGYPFHPPGKPDALRTAHLEGLKCPLLIVQGERDPFGTREEIRSYRLSRAIKFAWAIDGDHDLSPRAGHGTTHDKNTQTAADAIAAFAKSRQTPGRPKTKRRRPARKPA